MHTPTRDPCTYSLPPLLLFTSLRSLSFRVFCFFPLALLPAPSSRKTPHRHPPPTRTTNALLLLHRLHPARTIDILIPYLLPFPPRSFSPSRTRTPRTPLNRTFNPPGLTHPPA
ncbi:hypothetical protein M427DRAFT_50584 [Gonapodya prolifera JEL478]|uniref:Uncharacterized protein n=1 Tax=Gonapodya prolifera (strain JEL478) TaxID=1344416 RepID=A0A139AZW0_GONPJ|nr:hypothetical protein M427DRAFT_50584 [Gonapodya prolifera JEL478]|eukprot:KXS22247.1 hypothetical protein M427DRAFT_50584 [Gonapodya prolifera JEL478]